MAHRILIRGALIIPVDDLEPSFFRGDLVIEGGQIVAVQRPPARFGVPPTGAEVKVEREDRIIDGRELILMPGLVNAHGHAAMSLFRGYADDLPLMEWLEQKIWPAEANLNEDDVYWGTMLSITEMLKGGTTTFSDMYFFMDRVAEAVAESGIRAVLARGLIGKEDSNEALADSERFISKWHGHAGGRIHTHLGPHAPYTCPPSFLHQIMESATRTGRPMQIHLAETAGEVEKSRAVHGCSPVQHLERLGFFQYPATAAHCVHLDENDIAILAAGKVGVVHNPGSNLKLGSGTAPVLKLLEAGIKVGLGTDGAASNNNLDMLEEMRLAALLPKGLSLDPTRMPALTALSMATIGGAEALYVPQVGRLKEGWRADIIGFKTSLPHLNPMFDPPAHLVYAAAAADVSLVIVDGRILVEAGRLTALDEEKIIAEASRRAYRLTGKKPL